LVVGCGCLFVVICFFFFCISGVRVCSFCFVCCCCCSFLFELFGNVFYVFLVLMLLIYFVLLRSVDVFDESTLFL